MIIGAKADFRIFVFNGEIDMRAGFDRLSMLVREEMKSNLVDGDLFLFIGKNNRRIKYIYYDGTGTSLTAKRLDRGKFMRLFDLEEKEITVEELQILLHGGVVRRKVFGKIPLTEDNHLKQFI